MMNHGWGFVPGPVMLRISHELHFLLCELVIYIFVPGKTKSSHKLISDAFFKATGYNLKILICNSGLPLGCVLFVL